VLSLKQGALLRPLKYPKWQSANLRCGADFPVPTLPLCRDLENVNGIDDGTTNISLHLF
jgi:hypothetical protein